MSLFYSAGLGAAAIPDSEADQKLIHRWYLSEDADPFVDQIGSADGTNNGTTQVTGSQYVDDAARDGDGSSHITTSTLGNFGSGLDTDFAIALTLNTTDNDVTLLGERESSSYCHLSIGKPQGGAITGGVPNGQPVLGLRDDNGNNLISYADTAINDGSLSRLVANKVANTGSGAIEFWFDGTEQPVVNNSDQNPTSFSDFAYALTQFALNDQGTVTAQANAVLDDICIFGSSLTQSEIQSYTKP